MKGQNFSVKRIHKVLPIFRVERGGLCVLYAPGKFAALDAVDADLIEQAWSGPGGVIDDPNAKEAAAWIRTQAEIAVSKRRQWVEEIFKPECLTVYLSNYCNLQCLYCYAAGKGNRRPGKSASLPIINREAVHAAALLVARHCALAGLPFNLVLHGGGEPTLHWERVKYFERMTKEIARQSGIGWSGYIATNGVLPEEKSRWLGQHFTRVGISCDGPPEIQDRQRLLYGDGASSYFVERTVRAIREAGGQFEIRSTITPQTIRRQADIVQYLVECLGASDMRFEPSYRLFEVSAEGFSPEQAETFAAHFLQAQKKAQAAGCNLTFSGVRMEEIHGPYCDVLRNVLHLTPDGSATACFFCVDSGEQNFSKLRTGRYNEATGSLELDNEVIAAHRKAAAGIPDGCRDCINIFHCARSCPDACVANAGGRLDVNGRDNEAAAVGFRCLIQKRLGVESLFQTVEQSMQAEPDIHAKRADGKSPESRLAEYLKEIPSDVDAEKILDQERSLRDKYRIEERRMPAPLWAERGFEDSGNKAWERLSTLIPEAGNTGPLSVYVHIPFCRTRCGFCDCYSLPLGGKEANIYVECYIAALLNEIDAWADISPLAQRPVTTVHFGGGTPNCLSADSFGQIVNQLKTCYCTSSDTEWALESTSRLLTKDHLHQLWEWGFRRLHVGVQTLEEPLRHQIGRNESAAAVVKRLIDARECGFITTVDVIYGLPGQMLEGLLGSIKCLIEIGIHGVSLYRFNLSNRNLKFLSKLPAFSPDALRDYVIYQAAEQILLKAGYQKNHFSHFALPEDGNLYYTHAQRGEDLLAFGTGADGIFGHYQYRHPGFKQYIAGNNGDGPVFEGGIMKSAMEQAVQPAVASLMCGNISRSTLRGIGGEALLDEWNDRELVAGTDDDDMFVLTANGSWFIDQMIQEVHNKVR